MKRRLAAGLLVLLPLFAGCTARLPEGAVPPGDYVGHVDSREEDFRRRSYRIHVPNGSSNLPVLLVLHGAFSTARGIEKRSGFSQLADEEGFVAVYPNGYGFFGLLRHWNAGHCCGRGRRIGVDDIGFIDEVLDDVSRHVDVDPTRVYVVGESNGAMLAHLYASRRSNRIAGAAAVIGTIGSGPHGDLRRIPPPKAAVPMTIVHGSDDRIIPFHGGASQRDPDVRWVSAPDGAAFWVDHNAAQTEPEITRLFGGSVVRWIWQRGPAGSPVVLYEIRGWEHEWPGPKSTATLAEDDPLREFDAARVIWQHLRQHQRAQEIP